MGTATVEFFGVPRLRAGVAAVTVGAGPLRAVLAAAGRACPGVAGLIPGGRPGPHVLVSLDGERFVTDPDEMIPAGTRLLLLSADAGG